MTSSELKKLIREAVREELKDIILEAVTVIEEQKNTSTAVAKPGKILPEFSLSKEDTQIEDVSADPYNIKAMLRETVLTAADRQTIGQVGTVESMPASTYQVQASEYNNVHSNLPDFSSFLRE